MKSGHRRCRARIDGVLTNLQRSMWLLLMSLSPSPLGGVTWGGSLARAERTPPNNLLCDESKCRATRQHPWIDDEVEYTCWVRVNVTAAELADVNNGYCHPAKGRNYMGRLVDDENDVEIIDGELRRWYTCCLQDPTTSDDEDDEDLLVVVRRTCSDTACSSPDWTGSGNCWADGFQEPLTCGSQRFRYPRLTGLQSLIYLQYVCCESTTTFDDSILRELFTARIVWMVLSSISFLAGVVFIGGLVASRKARSQGFNAYLVFLAIPDAVANIMIVIRNALTIPGFPIHPNVFIVLASFEYFYAFSNMWLNAVIVSFIHRILYKAHAFVRVPPPTVGRVCRQAAIVYTMSACAFGWAFFLYHEGLNTFSLGTVVVVWISTRGVMVLPPLFYILAVCFDVWYRQLLPLSGRTRVVALYFLRVIVVFMVTWLPYFVIYELAFNITHSRFMVYFSYYLGSLQGLISILVALTKPDVERVFYRFLFCRCMTEETELDNLEGQSKFQSVTRFASRMGSQLTIGRTGGGAEAGAMINEDDSGSDEMSEAEDDPEKVPDVRSVAGGSASGGALSVATTPDWRTARRLKRAMFAVSQRIAQRQERDDSSWHEEDVWAPGHKMAELQNIFVESMRTAQLGMSSLNLPTEKFDSDESMKPTTQWRMPPGDPSPTTERFDHRKQDFKGDSVIVEDHVPMRVAMDSTAPNTTASEDADEDLMMTVPMDSTGRTPEALTAEDADEDRNRMTQVEEKDFA